jgi:hypothetical protein
MYCYDSAQQISHVDFYFSYDPDPSSDWTLFYTDNDGKSNSAPDTNNIYSPENDGWCGYLQHNMLNLEPAPVFFKAEAVTYTGVSYEVTSDFALTYDPTPPNSFTVNIEDGYITDQDSVSFQIIPVNCDFDSVVFQSTVALQPSYDKSVPLMKQPDSVSCGPTALAMCLKYFENSGFDGITGGLNDSALIQLLKHYVHTTADGTTEKNMEKGAKDWIKDHGGGFDVNAFKPFSEFGINEMAKHLRDDGLLNIYSQDIIPMFEWVKWEDKATRKVGYHYMTLSSIHQTGSKGTKRFDFCDPQNKEKFYCDVDENGQTSNWTDSTGNPLPNPNFGYDSIRIVSSMMICPNEKASFPTGTGGISLGPDLPPVKVPMPDSGRTTVRVRAKDTDGHKAERDIPVTRVRPAEYPPGDTVVGWGSPPVKLKGGIPKGGGFTGPHVQDSLFFPVDTGTFLITYSYTYTCGFTTSCTFYIRVVGCDFGDAPGSAYHTLYADNGARHLIDSDVYLGYLIDAEIDGLPTSDALGDDQDNLSDEDGVIFTSDIVPGREATVMVLPSVDGFLSAWMDFNQDGDWNDAGEQLFAGKPVGAGSNTLSFDVPETALLGATFSRFRFTTAGELSFEGSAPDGEVEDFMNNIVSYDFGDAPEESIAYLDPSMTGSFPTCITIPASGWIEHLITLPTLPPARAYFGLDEDGEPDGNAGWCTTPGVNPNKDECFDDGDAGLIKPGTFTLVIDTSQPYVVPCPNSDGSKLGYACGLAKMGEDIDILVHNQMTNGNPAYVNLLIDWNQDGYWGGSSDCTAGGITNQAHEHVLINIPVYNGYSDILSGLTDTTFRIGPNPGYVWARFSITETPVVVDWDGSGSFQDGETEDYLFLIGEQEPPALDWGDAPDSYATLLVSDGPRHVAGMGIHMGDQIDAEYGGLPDPYALGDDLDNMDDEDGVAFLTPLIPGQNATVRVKFSADNALFNAWIDLDRNGDFQGTNEHVIQEFSTTAGFHDFTIPIPSTASTGETYARFRYSTQPNLDYYGFAGDGEVEDYKVYIHQPVQHKMHDPQYPKLNGWDVNFTTPDVLADDWMCTQPGTVGDIHFWISMPDDYGITNLDDAIEKIYVAILADIPGSQSSTGYSMPADPPLWERTFTTGDYSWEEYFTFPQGWYSPRQGNVQPSNHYECYRIDLNDIPDPFIQEEGTIYWLRISIMPTSDDYAFGWKSAIGQWNDNAVFNYPYPGYPSDGWQELYDPDDADQPMDLAFYINGEEVICPEVFAGADATICPDDSYTPVDSWATDFGSLSWTSTGDGTFDDPASLHPVYVPGNGDIANGQVTLCLTASPIPPCPDPASDCLTLTISEKQDYTFTAGWHGISGYLNPVNPDIQTMFADLINNGVLTILYNPDLGVFWPGGNVYTLNTWDAQYGYILKTSGDAGFMICGEEVTDKTVDIAAHHWTVIPVLGKSPESIAGLFSSFGDQCVVKSIGNCGVYWPHYNINTIGNLIPGEAYNAYTNVNGSITYTTKGSETSLIKPFEPTNATPWNDVHQSPVTHVIAFPENVVSELLSGDIIGAFNSTGLCTGMVEYRKNPMALAVNGEDISTPSADGMAENEPLTYRLYRPPVDKVFDLEVVYDPTLDHSGVFHANGLSAVTDLKISSTGIEENTASDIFIYPNPSTGTFTIKGLTSTAEIIIYSSYGKQLLTRKIEDNALIDLSMLPKGVYLIKITGINGSYFEKLILK